MPEITRRQAIGAALLGAAAGAVEAWAAQPKKADDRLVKLMATVDAYRTKMPPAQGLGEQNGIVVHGMEPFTESHLAGVAKRLGVKTRAECLALLTYVKDADLKIRFIAIIAIDAAVNAYPHGMSIEDITDATSEGHRKLVLRFVELIQKLDA